MQFWRHPWELSKPNTWLLSTRLLRSLCLWWLQDLETTGRKSGTHQASVVDHSSLSLRTLRTNRATISSTRRLSPECASIDTTSLKEFATIRSKLGARFSEKVESKSCARTLTLSLLITSHSHWLTITLLERQPVTVSVRYATKSQLMMRKKSLSGSTFQLCSKHS